MFGFNCKRGLGQKYPRELKQMQIKSIPMTSLFFFYYFNCFYDQVSTTVYVSYIYEKMKVKFTINESGRPNSGTRMCLWDTSQIYDTQWKWCLVTHSNTSLFISATVVVFYV